MVSPAVDAPAQTAMQEEQADRRLAANAAERKRRLRRWQGVLVRLASLAVVLGIWEIGGATIDEALFATPSRVVRAAVQMIASGELWQFLAPSLLVMLYGFSIASDDSWTYLYGHCYRQFTNPGYAGAHDTSCGPDMYLARVPKGEFSTTPEYWAGGEWSGNRGDAVAVMHRGVAANPMQVRNMGGTFVSVTKIDDWFGLTVYVDIASSPAGPWTGSRWPARSGIWSPKPCRPRRKPRFWLRWRRRGKRRTSWVPSPWSCASFPSSPRWMPGRGRG